MRLLINTSTLKGTGVTQVAVSFINECATISDNEYIVFLSPNVSQYIDKEKFPSTFTFYEFGKNSLYGLKGMIDIYKMKRLEAIIKPDAVFSVFGPSLWRPKSPHLQGYAYPHYVYSDLPIFNNMSLKEKAGVKIRQFFHMRQLKHDGSYFVCETEDVSQRLHSIYNICEKNIFTVSNTANASFLNFKKKADAGNTDDIFRFYSLCSPYPHKNLGVLNSVIPILKNKADKQLVFYVTIDNQSYNRIFSEEVRDSIINVGPLTISECPAFVDSCDALFLPTLLECFSASYPEAMLMDKPILTSDLPFAKTVCEDAALYFDPYNAEEIADRIITIVEDEDLRTELVLKGRKRLNAFYGPRERAIEYIKICKKISDNEKG